MPLQSYLIPYGRSFSEVPWSIKSQISAQRIWMLWERTYAEERPLKHIIWPVKSDTKAKTWFQGWSSVVWYEVEKIFLLQDRMRQSLIYNSFYLHLFIQIFLFYQYVHSPIHWPWCSLNYSKGNFNTKPMGLFRIQFAIILRNPFYINCLWENQQRAKCMVLLA